MSRSILAALVLLVLAALSAGQSTKPAASTIVFVIDCSLSMRGNFATARDQVVTAIKQLPASAKFAVLVDIGELTQRFPHSGYNTAADNFKAAAERFLVNDKLIPKGDGQLDVAVNAACRMKPDVVWLMTDGDFPNKSEQVIARIIGFAKANGVPLDTRLALTSGRPREEILLKIAMDTGGRCLNDKGEAITELPSIKPETIKPGESIFGEK